MAKLDLKVASTTQIVHHLKHTNKCNKQPYKNQQNKRVQKQTDNKKGR